MRNVPEAGQEDVELITNDNCESSTSGKQILTEPIPEVEASRSEGVESSASPVGPSAPEVARGVVGPAIESSESDLSSNISRLRLQNEGPNSTFVEKGPEIKMRSLSERIITAPLPPADTSSSSPIEPALPSGEPSSRPGTPEPTILTFPENHLNTKAKAGHLHLPPSIPRTPSGDQILLSPDLSVNVSQSVGDPEDEDPSLSSFGNGIVQTVPVAQVGLRSPMFPGVSGFGLLLGAVDSTSRRFFPQQGGLDIDDEPDYGSTAPEKDNLDGPAEHGDKSDQEGEEGWNSLS